MFRKPRETLSVSLEKTAIPSKGRAPTPPNDKHYSGTSNILRSTVKPLTPQSNPKVNVLATGRQGLKKSAGSKTGGKPNHSILNFFKKVDSPTIEEPMLFLSQGSTIEQSDTPYRERLPSQDIFSNVGADDTCSDVGDSEDRYNECTGSAKRRKLGWIIEPENDLSEPKNGHGKDFVSLDCGEAVMSLDGQETASAILCASTSSLVRSMKPLKNPRRIGPFLDFSDSEDESVTLDKSHNGAQHPATDSNLKIHGETSVLKVEYSTEALEVGLEMQSITPQRKQPDPKLDNEVPDAWRETSTTLVESVVDAPIPPSLKRETTSFGDYGEFDDLEGFPDGEDFLDGEEFAERRYMEEQARLEAAAGEFADERPGEGFEDTSYEGVVQEGHSSTSCPICQTKLGGISHDEVSRHVNACLDGNPIPIPIAVKAEASKTKMMPVGAGSRFSRAGIARPGQANPFQLGSTNAAPSSAFSKLMSSHAEDAAWASAAAAEQAARGKPAYQRTCPFYKIMPGFFICVDAFRYGAVEGCNAYFLSHFHSDHYIGLTSTWSHGPIYCSKVTANLVKQQLRVDPKWVVPLEFETKNEVPGTSGVTVTMIPANHCPGSSLFLYEKVVGRGSSPKIQRVLHCGDFRACLAHVAHPLLMPDVVDSITGKAKQQKIDVCYLDTTYLNPRYAFPSQEDVIKACADMCVSLKKEKPDASDSWEVAKKERAGTGMAKFVGTVVKSEDSITMEVGSTKTRGRLLVICGTYSIGKERICMGIARALDCKIWAPPGKQRICAALEDPELSSRLTDDPREAQIHMQMLMEIRAETLQDYLNGFKPHFSRVVGFRPSGWNYRPPNSRFVESPAVQTVLMSDNWKSRYTMAELVPQRGSTREAWCFGVPYSEHSSFRELTIFCCALRIEKIIPTVNVGNAASRAKMKAWIDRWMSERKKNGVVKIGDGEGQVRW